MYHKSLCRIYAFTSMAPKKSNKPKPSDVESKGERSRQAIEVDKDGNINVNIHAKPGSKENGILGEIVMPDQPRLDVKISSRAVDGQANACLLEYLADVLGVRKGDCSIIRGMKSREKTVSIKSGAITLDDFKEKIKHQVEKHKNQ